MARRVARDRSDLRPLARELIRSPRRFWALCVTGVISATVEALLLIAVVNVAVALAEGGDSVTLVVPGTDWELGVGAVLALAVALTGVKVAAGLIGARLTAQQSTDTLVGLRSELYGAFVRSSWSRQSVERVGTLQDLLGLHTRQAAAAVLVGAIAVFSAVNFAVLVVIALVVQPLAALLILITVVALYFGLRPLTSLAYEAAHRSSETGVAYANTTIELTDMAEEVTTFDVGEQAEAVATERLQDAAAPHHRAEMMARLLPELYVSGTLLVVFAGLTIVAAFDTARVESLGVVVVLLVRALTRAQATQSAWHRVTEFLPYTRRVLAHRDQLRAHRADRGSAPVHEILPLELDGLDYRYGPDGADVLHAVSLRLERGEALGIVGPSGSGKTTLLETVLRLRAPARGTYTLNGIDADTLDRAEFTHRVAFVPQVPRLLTATVADNIRFLRPDLSDEAVRRAARLAHIDEEIEALEEGWDTVVSERGRGLSGGQRQRLCLARALVGDPDLLVLDEPTSALDSRSEELFCRSLGELVGELSVLLVAHRPSTLELCDRVLVLVDGRVEASGSPDEMRTTVDDSSAGRGQPLAATDLVDRRPPPAGSAH